MQTEDMNPATAEKNLSSSKSIELSLSEIPVSWKADVLVVGGGIAGIAAALAAARRGVDVILIEKSVSVGGLATIGNVIVYLPLCDGEGRQVSGGIAEELLLLAAAKTTPDSPGVRNKLGTIPQCWIDKSDASARANDRYTVEFNASTYSLDLEMLLINGGVRLLYDTRCVSVIRQTDRIDHVVIADKSGLSAIEVGSVVDATGDADVCTWAGESTASMHTNVACGWFYYVKDGVVGLSRTSNRYAPNPVDLPEGVSGFSADDGLAVTNQVMASRDLIRNKLASKESDSYPICIPQMATHRMSRRLIGKSEANSQSSLLSGNHGLPEDTIGIVGDWRNSGPAYSIPYGALNGKTPNLLAAGRCISIASDLWDVTRAIPACAVTGQAAGLASALAVIDQIEPANLDVTRLKTELQTDKVIFTYKT